MAKFTFGKTVDIHWNGYEIVGPALTVFSIPDQLYEEFEGDFRDVEPSLTWTDTNEFATLSNSVSVTTLTGAIPISVTSTTSGKIVSISSSTNPAGYYLRADGAGATTWAALPADATGITNIIGTSPISAAVSGTTATISLSANYQTSGTYVTAVSGTSPISASGTTSVTVSIDSSILTAENATRIRTLVRNTTASTITKGSVVYLDGSSGTVSTIKNALANADATSARTFGIVEADIATNSNGYVTNQGLLSPLDTSGVADGAVLWLSPTVAGAFTTTKPAGPNHGVLVGIVVKGTSVGAGSIYVLIKNGAELDEIHDVNITSLANGQALIYSSSASAWQNQALPVSAVIGTSPASVSTASGTSTVSIVAGSINSTHLSATSVGSSQLIAQAVGTAALSSGAAANGTILTSNGSGGATFASAPASGGYYVTGTSLVNGANLTSMATGPYLVGNPDSTSIEVISSAGATSTVAQYQYVYSSNRTSTSTRFPVMSSWVSAALTTSTADAGSRFINGEFWIFGAVSTAASAGLHRSSNSTSWTSVTSGLAVSDVITDIAYNGSNLYVFCGRDVTASVGKVSTSPGTSGSTWTARTINVNMEACRGVTSSGSRWVVVGSGAAGASGETLTSTDGVTWASNSAGSFALNSVAFGASTFVATGASGKIYTSPSTSGSVWTLRTSGVTTSIGDITYANGIFAACTASSILTSSDGITWTSSSVGVAVTSIVYATFTNNGSRWVATGGNSNWAFSVNSPPSGWTTGTRGNLTNGGTISYNNNILLSANTLARVTRAVETTSFNSVWNPVTVVAA